MLKIANNLSGYSLAAGEPFILSVQLRESSNAVIDHSTRNLVLSFYDTTRKAVAQIPGVLASDASGAFFRFVRDGRFSDGLFGQSLQVELAEQLLDGRDVLATGPLSIERSSGSIASYGSLIGRTEIRAMVYYDTAGIVQSWELSRLRYAGGPVTPAPTLGALSLSGILRVGTASSGTIIGATDGSTITENVTGFSVNSAARTYAYDGTGSAGDVANGLVETLSGATNSGRQSAVTIAAAIPTIYFDQPTISATEGNSGTKTLTLTLLRSTSVGAIAATATFVQGSAGAADFAGNALPGNKVFTFADGATSATATVGISGDTDVESDETFGYQLVAPSGYALGSPNSITGTILNDDSAPLPTVTLSAATASANEGGAGTTLAWVYTVTRSTSAGAATVSWSFSAGTTDAADWNGGTLPTGGGVVFANGEASKTFSVISAGDTTTEPDESFSVSITAPSGYAAGTSMSATGTILNDDVSETPSAFAMTQLATPNRDYQRTAKTGGAGAGTGSIPVTLNVTQAGALYARTRNVASGNAVLQAAWKVTNSVPTGTGPVQITGVHARLEQFYLDLSPDGTTWTNGTTPVGMGKLVGYAGQSLIEAMRARIESTDTFAALGEPLTNNGRVYREGNWMAPSDDSGSAFNSVGFNAFIRLQSAVEGCRVSLVGYAQGATAIEEWIPGSTTCYPKLEAALNATGNRIESFIWWQGHSDSSNNAMTGNLYRKRLSALFTAVDALSADKTFTRYLSSIPTSATTNWGYPYHKHAIRIAADRWCRENPRAVSVVMDDIDVPDGTHESQKGAQRAAVHLHRAHLGTQQGFTTMSIAKSGAVVTIGIQVAAGVSLSILGDLKSRIGVWTRGSDKAADALAISSVAVGAVSNNIAPLAITLAADPGDVMLDVWFHPKPDPATDGTGNILISDKVDSDGFTFGRQITRATPVRLSRRVDLVANSSPAQAAGRFSGQGLSAGAAATPISVTMDWAEGFTAECWIKTGGQTGTNVFFWFAGNWIAFDGTSINFTNNGTVSNVLPANQWNHFAVTVDAGPRFFHVNGVLVRTDGPYDTSSPKDARIAVRGFPDGGFRPTDGTVISDVALFRQSMYGPDTFTPPSAPYAVNEPFLQHLWRDGYSVDTATR